MGGHKIILGLIHVDVSYIRFDILPRIISFRQADNSPTGLKSRLLLSGLHRSCARVGGDGDIEGDETKKKTKAHKQKSPQKK